MVFKFKKIIPFVVLLLALVQNCFSAHYVLIDDFYTNTKNKSLSGSCEVEALSLPNALTPNGDGKNDSFCLYGWDACVEAFEIMIFNRWGELVFESKQADFCWDGSFNGKILETSVLVYVIKAQTKNGDVFKKSGNISLIR